MKVAILIVLCFIFIVASGQEQPGRVSNQLFFKHLSVDEGLSQPTVNCIIRDKRGFVWIATEDGLNRYDGNRFKIFRHDAKDSTTISHSVVYSLLEEKSTGNLWVGTANGLSYFNRSTESFTRIPAINKPGTAYSGLAMDDETNTLWIANGMGGVRYLNVNEGKIHDLDHDDLKNIVAWTLQLKDGNLYIGTIAQGLKVYNTISKTVTSFNSSTQEVSGNKIRSLLASDDYVWIGTQGEGLYALDYKTQTIEKHVFDLKPQSRGIWALAMDKDKNLWIGTDGRGLIIYSPIRNDYKNFNPSEKDPHGLNDNTIRSILMESSGDVWLGTYIGGVNYHPELPLKFLLYKKEYGTPFTLSDPSVMSFAEDDDKLWMGTDNGLNVMKDGVIKPYGKIISTDRAEVILSLLRDKSGGLWIGTYDLGLYHLDKKKNITSYVHDPKDPTSLPHNIVWDLTQDSHGNIWAGTENGIARFNPITRQFENSRNKPNGKKAEVFDYPGIRTLLVTSDGSLWIGIYGDLIRYNYKTDQVTRFTNITDGPKKIEGVRVISLCEDKNNNVWVGTYGDGLCKFDNSTQKFSIITQQEGLPNDFVLAMHPGVGDDLWMTTNTGIVYFNIRKGTFLTFDQNYGVQGNTFNRSSSCQLKNGDLVFGGAKGFNIFTPVEMHSDTTNLTILLTDFKIFNESIRPGSKLMPKSITELDKLDLPYKDSRLISIQFAALQFVAPQQVRYTYKLENFSNEWQDAGNGHTVTFTSLEPGNYKLAIRASLNDQSWGPEKTIGIVIRPPWYQTMTARIAGIASLALIAFTFYRLRTRSLHHQKQKLEKLVQEQSKEIKDQNDELAAQNEELLERNEELAAQKELMEDQNKILQETQRQMAELNQSLEKLVAVRTKSLDDTIHQLNKTIRELDAFVYSASHDLIAPLKSVLGLIQLSRKGNEGNAELMTYLNYMEESIKKLDEIIKNMIQYSRNSKLELKYEALQISKEVEECIQDFKFMKGFDEINFQIQINPNAQVVSDKQRLRIILSNLIGNAIKYYDPSKPTHEVSIKYENGSTTWKLNITDNGIGIDKRYLSKVFEMFYRGTDRAYGSGLGLYIVRETVDRLDGEIFIDSEKGSWTKFELIFPVEGDEN